MLTDEELALSVVLDVEVEDGTIWFGSEYPGDVNAAKVLIGKILEALTAAHNARKEWQK